MYFSRAFIKPKPLEKAMYDAPLLFSARDPETRRRWVKPLYGLPEARKEWYLALRVYRSWFRGGSDIVRYVSFCMDRGEFRL